MNPDQTEHFYGTASRKFKYLKTQLMSLCSIFQLDEQTLTAAPAFHPHSDAFFRKILKFPPQTTGIFVRKDDREMRLSPGLSGVDIRQILCACNRQGGSIHVCCNIHDQYLPGSHPWTVTVTRRYHVHSFSSSLRLMESFGLPEPSLIQTRGDNWLRYIYFLQGFSSNNSAAECSRIQDCLEVALAGADISPDVPNQLLVPGFNYPTHLLAGSPRVRTVGGSLESCDAALFMDKISALIGSLSLSADSSSWSPQPGEITSQDVHNIASQILAIYDLVAPFHQYHFFVSYWRALEESSGPRLASFQVQRFLPFEVDAYSCLGHESPLSKFATSDYFWGLAQDLGISTRYQNDAVSESLSSGDYGDYVTGEESDFPCVYEDSLPSVPIDADSSVSRLVQQGKADAETLRLFARTLCADTNTNPVDIPQFLKSYAKTLSTKFDASYIENILKEALLAAKGVSEPLTPRDLLQIEPTPWLWDSLLIKGALNLIVAQPKAGKTSLMLAFLAALLKSQDNFLGYPIYGGRFQVVIIGTDQPAADWIRMLREFGLVTSDSRLHPSIVALYTASHSLYFDERGLDEIEGYARRGRDEGVMTIYLGDSLAACTAPLGYDENSQTIAVPICQLMARLSPYQSTILLVHHSGKSSTSESPTAVSRGSSAIPATASQIISLRREAFNQSQPEVGNDRITLETQGRAGQSIKIVIQRTKDGWINIGDQKRINKSLERETLLAGLNERQRALLDLVEGRWLAAEYTTSNDALHALSSLLDGNNKDRTIRSVFDQLRVKGLLESMPGSPLRWKPKGC